MDYITHLLTTEKSITEFLPYSEKSLVASREVQSEIIKNLKYFLNLCVSSITYFFETSHYECFDAQVSENLCQIRGYLLLCLIRQKATIRAEISSQHLLQVLQSTLIHLDEQGKHLKTLHSRQNGKLDFKTFISTYQLDIIIPHWLYYLAITAFLCRYNLKNEAGVSLAIDYNKLCSELAISKTLARRIIHHLQKIISEISTAFILSLASSDSELSMKKYYYLNHFIQTDDDGRTVLPCYAVMDIILNHAYKNPTLLVIVVKRYRQGHYHDSLLLGYESNQNGFVAISLTQKKLQKSALIIEGRVTYQNNIESLERYLQRLTTLRISEVIMANMAKHPQYSGFKLAAHKEDPYCNFYHSILLPHYTVIHQQVIKSFMNQFKQHKMLAQSQGFCQENDATFLPMHIYCAKINCLVRKFQDALVVSQPQPVLEHIFSLK